MRIRHIEIFYAVYRHESISAAARKLNVSQPAVSKALRHTEDQIGFSLFTRTGRGLVPTEQAHQLFEDVSKVYSGIAQIRRTTREIRNSLDGRLKISTVTGLGFQILPRTVARWRKRHPNTSIEVQTLHYSDLIASIRDFDTDIGLVFEAPKHTGLVRHNLGPAELSCVFPATETTKPGNRVSLAEFLDFPFIALNPDGPLGGRLWGEINLINPDFEPAALAESSFIAKSLAASGVGHAVVDEFTGNSPGFSDLDCAKLDPPLEVEVNALTLESRPLTKSAANFIEDLKSELAVWRTDNP